MHRKASVILLLAFSVCVVSQTPKPLDYAAQVKSIQDDKCFSSSPVGGAGERWPRSELRALRLNRLGRMESDEVMLFRNP